MAFTGSPAARALAAEICQVARDAGLDAVGIARAEPFVRARRALEERAASGLSAGMAFTYRHPERATDPTLALPGASSLVVGARRYLRQRPDAAAEGDQPRASVARYSWVDHYRPLRDGLGQVSDRLRRHGWRTRMLVDDNSLMDREAAYQAGLGWYGKNTNLLLPGAGSWFVLGSVVTDAWLPAGTPVEDGCGACERCRQACPTGALVGERRLDARRCLAWLLQQAGVFPFEFRVALGDRIYGCDDCQESCPVNRRAERRAAPAAAEVEAEATVAVLDLLGASDEELLRRWGRWYIPRRQPGYLRRNALVVLGNVGRGDDPAVEAALRRALCHLDPLLRAHAVWASARVGRQDLLYLVDGDKEPMVEEELARLGEVPVRSAGGSTGLGPSPARSTHRALEPPGRPGSAH